MAFKIMVYWLMKSGFESKKAAEDWLLKIEPIESENRYFEIVDEDGS